MRKSKKPKPRKRPEYVTREMLADLRDEIEDVLEDARLAADHAGNIISKNRLALPAGERLDLAHDRCAKLEKTTARLEAALRKVQNLVHPIEPEPNAPELSERVTWSYFHSWMRQINRRLDELEKKIGGKVP